MKRRGIVLAVIGVLLLVAWGLRWTGWLSQSDQKTPSARTGQTKSAAPLTTPAGWRYRQSQPHHWRYIMLRK